MMLRVKELREKAGMSQSELSRRAGVTRATIWKLETRDDEITTTKTLERLASALRVPVRDLFFRNAV